MRVGLGWALCLAAAACGKSDQKVGARLGAPSAVAAYRGYTAESPVELRDYLAVANARTNELRILDLSDEQVLLAPAQYAPLSVPTGARPARLAGASLHDGGADALVVVPGGTAEIQLVETWTEETRVVPGATVDLRALLGEAEILALTGAPVPVWDGGSSSWVPGAGQARILAGLTGGRIAVLPVTRGPEGSIGLGAPLVATLGFDPVSIAVSPDPSVLYAASPDPIGGVLGVAEIGASEPDPQAWTVRGLDARAPTYLVAAADVNERLFDVDFDAFSPVPVRRVYAALEPTACGLEARVPCGIAVIDPVAGALAADPAGEAPYLAPIPLPGRAVAIAVSGPPANGTIGLGNKRNQDANGTLLLLIAPGSGQQYTSDLLVVPTTEGHAYWIDASRWRTPNDISTLRSSGTGAPPGVAVTEAVSRSAFDSEAGVYVGAFLGICAPDAGPAPPEPPSCVYAEGKDPDDPTQPSVTPAVIRDRILLTPGYTSGETWTLVYEGILPGLSFRRGVLIRQGGLHFLALQEPNDPAAPPGSPPYLQVVRVFDPSLGIHAQATHGTGDRVVVAPDDAARCGESFGVQALDLVAPDDARFAPGSIPGGALALEEPACALPLAEGESLPVRAAVRASGLLLVGSRAGYAGRPTFDAPFELRYADEDSLACPLLPWSDTPPACDATCRGGCEALLLARKARRLYYLADRCPDEAAFGLADPCTNYGWDRLNFPHPTGPVVAFQVASFPRTLGDGTTDPVLQRGAQLTFRTTSGMSPAGRRPLSSSGTNQGVAVPADVAAFDRSTIEGREEEGLRFYVPYGDNLVLGFDPAVGASQVNVIR